MSKFKVGDKVTVDVDSGGGKAGITEDMPFEAVVETLEDTDYSVRSAYSTWWVVEEMLTEIKTEPVVSIWSDYMGHLSKALDGLTKAVRDMNQPYGDSELTFVLEGQIRATIYGEPTEWVLAYDKGLELFTFQIREPA